MATQRFASASHSNIGKSTTHSGCQPVCASFRSWPTLMRNAPIESFTTFAVSAPKKIRSPSSRAGARQDAGDRVVAQELQDRRLQAVAALRLAR